MMFGPSYPEGVKDNTPGHRPGYRNNTRYSAPSDDIACSTNLSWSEICRPCRRYSWPNILIKLLNRHLHHFNQGIIDVSEGGLLLQKGFPYPSSLNFFK